MLLDIGGIKEMCFKIFEERDALSGVLRKKCTFKYWGEKMGFHIGVKRGDFKYWREEMCFQMLAGIRRAFILAEKDALSDTGGKEQIRWAAGIPRDVPSTLKTRRNFSSF